jgi:hypothetical protein
VAASTANICSHERGSEADGSSLRAVERRVVAAVGEGEAARAAHGHASNARLLSVAVTETGAIGSGEPAEGVDFDLVAASLRSSSGDLATFVEVVAAKLERALPARVKVQRRAVRFLGREKRVVSVECELGEQRYLLAAKDGAVETRRATAVRGVVLKSEVVPLDAWIDALARDLAAEAASSERSRVALEQLLTS